ncbi:unnamed protein product [Gongylonema pulchrum]|uniref:N-acetylglucosaminylphosphatidylinositol deacetylase n=1 Tax=Gongylonema pulchrum TaxID=637853 RepID=A0A183DZ05_9BILA|nr:unnamed protein product [Gongylonema pulchrum]
MRCSRSRCIIILFLIFAIFGLIFWKFYQEITLQELILVHYVSDTDGNQELPSGSNCTVDTCLDLLPCSLYDDQLTIFVEPLVQVFAEDGSELTPQPSREFLEIRSIVEESMYAVNAAEDACFVIPGFDTLNMDRFHAGQRSPLKNFNAVAATTSFKNNYLCYANHIIHKKLHTNFFTDCTDFLDYPARKRLSVRV